MKQQKELLIGFAAIVVILAGLIAISKISAAPKTSLAPASGARGILEAGETAFDFGEISMAKGAVAHRFRIENNSAEETSIARIYTSCMCTTANLIRGGKKLGPFGMPGHGLIPRLNQKIAPGEKAEIEVIFDPAAHGPAGLGPIERVVYLENASESGQMLELRIKARVIP